MGRRVRVGGDLFHGVVPLGATYIGRHAPGLRRSPWANPFAVGRPTPPSTVIGGIRFVVAEERVNRWPQTTAEAVTWYREAIDMLGLHDRVVEDLAGRDLACWCPVGSPCHGDVLLAIVEEVTSRAGAS